MDDRNQDMAGRIMAHAFNDELEKIAIDPNHALLAAELAVTAGPALLGSLGYAGYKGARYVKASPAARAKMRSAAKEAIKGSLKRQPKPKAPEPTFEQLDKALAYHLKLLSRK